MQNEIVKNTVVTLNYTVRDPDGAIIDDGQHPLVYLHGGYDGIFPLLEEALHGKKVGEQLKVKLQPEDAFGDYDEELVLVEDAKLFPDNIEIGMSFERVSDDGETVLGLSDDAGGNTRAFVWTADGGMQDIGDFGGPETFHSKIFGRLSAWQNWIFIRPNAVGENGALKVFGTGSKPRFAWERV